MIRLCATNIVSSLGFSSKENYEKVTRGISGVKLYPAGTLDVPKDFCASMIDNERLEEAFGMHCEPKADYTKLEKAAILSVVLALEGTSIDPADNDTLFILSSTKGNVDFLETDPYSEKIYLWHSSRMIADYFGNPNTPMIVSNACISGACAQIVAHRELSSGKYHTAIVVGADMLCKFIVSGFQTLRAMSPTFCRPFDVDRKGLNLGEVAATMVYRVSEEKEGIELVTGAIRNDANHISGPSRTGEGGYNALKYICRNIESKDIAFINAHGTATLYNDEMESIAITRAGLGAVPVNCLKGYYGHTLGAAGVLEAILASYALQSHNILATKGFGKLGVSQPIDVVGELRTTDKNYFIKLLSGFGGTNAAMLFKLWRNGK